jgi:putative phosphoribosyl transferase
LANSDQLTIRELRVSLQLDDVTLEGHLAIPEEPHGLVIFAHGSGSSRHSPRNRSVAKRLNETHLATLLFDLLTEEEQARDQTSGQFRFNILLLARRLANAVDSMTTRSETAGMKIGLFGASTGAAAALITAAERVNEVATVVSRGGRPDLAMESLSRVVAPTLLIVGQLDHDVVELNQRAYAQLQTEKRLDIVTGATHLFEEPGTLEAVADLATQWFARYLQAKDARSAATIDVPAEPDRRTNTELPNKREIIQAVIDEEEEPWIIMKPSRQDPTDQEAVCVFENPAEQTQAKAEIPAAWFQNRELQKIKEAIQQSLRHAVKMTSNER